MSRHYSPRTVATCVFRGHETPEHDRGGCPLVQALIRRIQDNGSAAAPVELQQELDRYRTVARVLDCPLVARLAVTDLHALVAARELSLRSDWAREPARLDPALA